MISYSYTIKPLFNIRLKASLIVSGFKLSLALSQVSAGFLQKGSQTCSSQLISKQPKDTLGLQVVYQQSVQQPTTQVLILKHLIPT